MALVIGQNVFSQTFYNPKSTFYSKFQEQTPEGEDVWFVRDDINFERTDGDTTFYDLHRETVLKKQDDDLRLNDLDLLELDDKVLIRGRVGSINYFGEGVTLFDFSLNKGDTVSFVDPTLAGMPIKRYVIDSIGLKKFVDGSIRSTQYIRPLFSYSGPPIFISKGIGPSNGILGFIDEMLLVGLNKGYSELISVCFDDDIRYSNSTYSHIDSGSCDSDTFKQRIILHTVEIPKPDQLLLYPNPATHILYLDHIAIDELYIFSYAGKQMDYHRSPAKEIPISHFPQGLYYIKSVYKNKWSVIPFIKK
ncbi:MAG: T9SS type A sorting domain-containing protein [Bacteroidia bacterium]|nr:T9SS type A sorting domain-containing protein [Bacteroidia bacterium]